MAVSLADEFNLRDVIVGLGQDLAERRSGKITIEDAKARAELAKQLFNGLRLAITARKYLEEAMKPVPQVTHRKGKMQA